LLMLCVHGSRVGKPGPIVMAESLRFADACSMFLR
jgi:hypothetical protein